MRRTSCLRPLAVAPTGSLRGLALLVCHTLVGLHRGTLVVPLETAGLHLVALDSVAVLSVLLVTRMSYYLSLSLHWRT